MTPAAFRDWLRRLGLTEAAAARLLGVHKNTVHRRANGRVEIPREVELACRYLEEHNDKQPA